MEEDIASRQSGRNFAVGFKNLNVTILFLSFSTDLTEGESGRVQGMPKEQTEAPQTATVETPVHGDHPQTCPRTHGEWVQVRRAHM